MATHMKTTIDVWEPLFQTAKQLALKNNTTMRSLVEEGLSLVIREQSVPLRKAFELEDKRVTGGTMLITNPDDWREFEVSHPAKNIVQPAKKLKKFSA